MAHSSHARRPETDSRRAEILRDAQAEMERRFAEPLAVDDVARAVGTSRRQLQRVFEEVANTTFRTYLAEVRMRHAADRLEGGRTVAAIARSVGYRQPAQFAKAFRRHHGVSPSEARAEKRERAA
jgi:AraC family transcriptional regulator of adaptative response / methylphosphotriester-DNA alkyltransferase methyltransferase